MIGLKVIIKEKTFQREIAMLKKYALIAVVAISGLANSLNGMEQKPGLVARFKSWWNKPRVDYVEKNMPQVPAHPVYPAEKELKEFKNIIEIDRKSRVIGRSPEELAQAEEKYKQDVAIGRIESNPDKMARQLPRRGYPFNKYSSPRYYSEEAPNLENLKKIEENIIALDTDTPLSVADWSRWNKSEREKGWWGSRSDIEYSERQLDRAEVQRVAENVRKTLLQQYFSDAKQWLSKRDKVVAQQFVLREFARQKEESFVAVPVNPYE